MLGSRGQRVLALTLPVLSATGGDTVVLTVANTQVDAQALTRRAAWLKA